MIYVSVHEKENDQSLPQKLEQAIRLTLMEKGSSRFCFWQDSTEIVQTTFVEQNTDSLTLEQAMAKYASDLHATQQQKGDGCFILSGHLYTETGQMTGRRFYAKFVQHRKLWFVQTLAYPEEC